MVLIIITIVTGVYKPTYNLITGGAHIVGTELNWSTGMYWYNFYTYSNLLVRIELGPSWKNWSLHNLMVGIYMIYLDLPHPHSNQFRISRSPTFSLWKLVKESPQWPQKTAAWKPPVLLLSLGLKACNDCNVGPRNGCWLTKKQWIWVNYHIVSYSIIPYVIICHYI